MSESSPFPALMPGFDFLQGLVRQAGTALPGMNAWITPTLDPEELDKRISELRTVQFWLEQNARLLGTTIQGLEVQRMTLNTLRSMNVSMGDLREAMAIRPAPSAPAEPTPEPTPEPAPAPAPKPASLYDRMGGQPAITALVEDYQPDGRRFDVVGLFQTVDHLLDIERTLKVVRALIYPPGVLFVDIVDFRAAYLRNWSVEEAVALAVPSVVAV